MLNLNSLPCKNSRKIMSIRELVSKYLGRIASYESRIQEYVATIAKISADADSVAQAFAELQKQYADLQASSSAAASEASERIELLMGELAVKTEDLNAITSELEKGFDPQPISAAIVETVICSEEVITPQIVADDITAGTSTETPAEVVEAATEAIVEAIAAEVEAEAVAA
jgi:glycine cleavage system regulatory protein